MKTCGYFIICSQGFPVYVGVTHNPSNRWSEHKCRAKNPKAPISHWIKGEIEAGRMPSLRIARWFADRDSARNWEMEQIREISAQHYRRTGRRSQNING